MSIGLFLVICLVVFLLVGLPIGFSLGLTAVSYFFYTDNLRYLIVLAQRTFNGINSFELIAIPLCMARGYSYQELQSGMISFIPKCVVPVLLILTIGALIGAWCASGTIALTIRAPERLVSIPST